MQTPLRVVPTATSAPIADSEIAPVQTILVGFASDETGTLAFRYALALAICFGAKLIAVRAIQRPSWGVVDVSYDMLAEDFLKQEKKRVVETVGRLRGDLNVECSCRVSFDTPVHLLMSEVEREHADLVVLGCHGTDGFEALLLGSISRSMSLLCSCPVLVLNSDCLQMTSTVRVEDSFGTGPVLLASDVRYTDMRTAEYAKEIATRLSRELVVLHVLPTTQTAAPQNVVWVEDLAKEQMRILLGEAPGENAAQLVVKHGEPAAEILAEAARRHAGLTVVGGGIHHAGIDHVPWETLSCVLRQSACPVLVVPANSK